LLARKWREFFPRISPIFFSLFSLFSRFWGKSICALLLGLLLLGLLPLARGFFSEKRGTEEDQEEVSFSFVRSVSLEEEEDQEEESFIDIYGEGCDRSREEITFLPKIVFVSLSLSPSFFQRVNHHHHR